MRNQISNHFEQGISFTLARMQDKAKLFAPKWLKLPLENQLQSSDRTYSSFCIDVESANKQALRSYLPQNYPLPVTLGVAEQKYERL